MTPDAGRSSVTARPHRTSTQEEARADRVQMEHVHVVIVVVDPFWGHLALS
jgi:hypothetical protein